MSNYTYVSGFGAKDALNTGDPNKVIKGSDFETEFTAISTAVNSKADTASPTFTGTVTIGGVTYPTSDGSPNQVLTTDGAGNLSFSTTALGFDPDVDAFNIGNGAVSSGVNSIALGHDSGATAEDALATGHGATASAIGSSAYGRIAQASGAYSIAVGQSSYAAGSGAISIGRDSDAYQLYSIAIGQGAQATGSNQSIAIGKDATTFNGLGNGIAIGSTANVTGAYGVGLGFDATTSGAQGVAIGYIAHATGTDSIAIGRQLTIAGNQAIGIGYGASAPNISCIAIGHNASASAVNDSISIGRVSTASGTDSVAVGAQSSATGTGSVALGRGAVSSGSDSVALGDNANATLNNSIVINSSGSVTTPASTFGVDIRTSSAGSLTYDTTNKWAFGSDVTVSGSVQIGTNWKVRDNGSGVLIFSTGGVDKMKLDASGNLTVVGNVTAFGTI